MPANAGLWANSEVTMFAMDDKFGQITETELKD